MTVSSMGIRSRSGAREDGWWYPWIFVVGMAFVVLINGIMVYIALSTWTGLETERHYDKGLAYNENLAAARAQAELGWLVDVAYTPSPIAGDPGELAVTVTAAGDRPLVDLDVTALLIRPTHEGFDQEVRLDHAGAGVYKGPVAIPLPGQWDARIHARRRDAEFQEVKRLFVP